MTWDDLNERLDRRPTGGAAPRKPVMGKHEWPALLREMFDDPKRPRALTKGDAYPIHEHLMKTWMDAEETAHPEIVGNDASARVAFSNWDDTYLRAAGYVPGEVAPNGNDFRRGPSTGTFYGPMTYYDAVSFGVLNALMSEAPTPTSETDDDTADMLPDEGATIEEIAEALDVSRRTAESRIGRLVARGSVRFEEEPTGRGGKPRKRYFRAEGDAS